MKRSWFDSVWFWGWYMNHQKKYTWKYLRSNDSVYFNNQNSIFEKTDTNIYKDKFG